MRKPLWNKKAISARATTPKAAIQGRTTRPPESATMYIIGNTMLNGRTARGNNTFPKGTSEVMVSLRTPGSQAP
jgi:hypothetical protein